MAIKLLTKVNHNEIYQITTASGKNIKASISAKWDSEKRKVWMAHLYIRETGKWEFFMSEREVDCGEFINFLNKLDFIFRDD